eukprot:1539272-Pleurochrysis_carterae.AAC.1
MPYGSNDRAGAAAPFVRWLLSTSQTGARTIEAVAVARAATVAVARASDVWDGDGSGGFGVAGRRRWSV